MNDKQSVVDEILGPIDKAESEEKKIGSSENSDPAHMIGEELMECFHKKDVNGLIQGLKALVQEFRD